jgi:AcrR family transcriptional regulator
MTRRKTNSLSWGTEVGNVLKEADLTIADLAQELGVNRATVCRYFDRPNGPKRMTIERVNNAAAKLVAPVMRFDRMPDEPTDDKLRRAREDIAGYLEAVAVFEFGEEGDAAELGLRLAFQFIEEYIEPHAVELVDTVLSQQTRRDQARKLPRGEWRVTKLGRSLLFELRRIRYDLARASYPQASRFDRITAIFEGADPLLKDKLTPKADVLPLIVYERFHSSIARVLASHVPDPDTRLQIRDGIEGATRELINGLNKLPTYRRRKKA